MNKCEISIGNGLPEASTYPELMKSLLEYTNFDTSKAINLYGISLLEDYNKVVESPNDLNSFLRYIQSKNIEGSVLKSKDNIYFNTLLNQSDDSINFKEEFIKTFSNEGLYEFNYHKILDGKLDISDPQNNKKSLENIFYYLLKTESDFETYDSPLEQKEDYQIFNLKVDFANIQDRKELIQRAVELDNSEVINNVETQDWLLDFNKNKTFVPKMFITDTMELKPTTDNISNRLMASLDVSQDFSTIKESLSYFIGNFEELIVAEDEENLEKFTKSLERNLVNKGFPMNNLSDTLLNSNIENSQNFLGSLYNFLEDIESMDSNISDSLYELSLEYNNFFNVSNEPTLLEIDKVEDSESIFHVKTNLSDAKMFANFGLVSVGDNLYKIYTVSNIDYNEYYNDDMRNDFLDSFEEGDSVDEVKALVVMKSLSLVSLKSVGIDSRYYRDVSVEYENFLTDFNKLLLKNEYLAEMFSFTENGLEAKTQISDFSVNLLKSELEENVFKALQDYALISGNESLNELLPEFSPVFEKNDDIYRNFILNNPKNLLSLKSDYKKIGDNIVADGVSDNFIKVDGNIYERIEDNNFTLLPKSDIKVFNVMKPQAEINSTEEEFSEQKIEITIDKTKQKFC